MFNALKSLFQIPMHQIIILFIASIVCLILNIEFKRANRIGLSVFFYALGTLTFITLLLMGYKIIKS